jgi:hypothetical protein
MPDGLLIRYPAMTDSLRGKRMFLKSKASGYFETLWRGAFLAAALAMPAAAPAQSYGNENTGSQSTQPAQPTPEITPQMPADLSTPGDCKVIDDELALIDKFSHNPKATKTQLDANTTRADKLKANREALQCPVAGAK